MTVGGSRGAGYMPSRGNLRLCNCDACSNVRGMHPRHLIGCLTDMPTVGPVSLQDLREIFETIEAIPQAPKKLFEGLRSWARGEQDPTWRK